MEKELQDRVDNPDLLVVSGSRLYGYSQDTSDWDERGFCGVSYEYLLGRKRFDQHEINKPEEKKDIVIYSFPKFFSMLEKCVPNITELLWVNSENILHCSSLAQTLLDNREAFVSKQMIKPMMGFSSGEWNKVIHPERGEKGEKRRQIIAQHGFDTKSAGHAFRLLYQAKELLEMGEIKFPLQVAPQLKRMRDGEFSLAQLIPLMDQLNGEVKQLLDTSTFLPDTTNIEQIEGLYYYLIAEEMGKFPYKE